MSVFTRLWIGILVLCNRSCDWLVDVYLFFEMEE